MPVVNRRAIRRIGDYFDALLARLSWSAVKLDLYGLKFFYNHVLNKPWVDVKLIQPPRTQRIPDILSVEEVQKLVMATNKVSYRVFFFTLYSLGLRLGEGLRLAVGDIDAQRMRVHIRNAKGNKDRLVPLPVNTLAVLRRFWSLHQHPAFLFPSRKRGLKNAHLATMPMDRGGVQVAMKAVVQGLGLKKKISCHSLRHSYATHLLEAGVDIIELHSILGACQYSDHGTVHAFDHRYRIPCRYPYQSPDSRFQHYLGDANMIHLSSIIKQFESDFLSLYGAQLLASQRKALAAMKDCRSSHSPMLRAHCPDCDHVTSIPHSCGHRSCPHCQAHESQQWIARQCHKQLPGNYFMITFTLPKELRPLAWSHQRVI